MIFHFILGIVLFVLVLLSCSPSFCNFYADYIYGYINAAVGSVTAGSSIAIGEIAMYLGVLILLTIPIFLLLSIGIKKQEFHRFVVKYLRMILTLVQLVLIIYCTNWLIPFRSDTLIVSESDRREFTVEEVAGVYSQIVDEINRLSKLVDREADGHLIYDYSDEEIFTAMRALAPKYVRLAGHYSKAKTALCSDFLEWMDIGGYNYIYTMEPTLNRYLYPLSKPYLYAHELAHHKGYYKENEANFLGFVALRGSDNLFLQYCAYLNIYSWIANAYYDHFDDSLEIYQNPPRLSEIVYEDIYTSRDEGETFYQEHVNRTLEENFSEASEKVADKGWEIQGNVLKSNTYSGVTLMILQYYDVCISAPECNENV